MASSGVCAGTTVTASVSVTGTVSGYQWYKDGNPVIGQTLSTLTLPTVQLSQAGSYSVVVTGVCNSLTSTAFSLTVNPTPSVSLASNGTLTCTQTSVVVTAQVPGNVQDYTYAFSRPSVVTTNFPNAIFAIRPGLYSVSVTSKATGCTALATTTVISNTAAPTNLSLTASNTISCNQPSATLTASATTTADNLPLTYRFRDALSATPLSVTGNQATASGVSIYSVTATAGNGCTATTLIGLGGSTQPPALTLVNNGPLSCGQPLVTLTASASALANGAPFHYVFSGPNGEIAAGTAATTQVSEPGTYSVRVTSAGGCSNTATSSVSLTSSFVATAGASSSSALVGSGLSLSVTGGSTYLWSAPAGASLSSPATTSLVSATLTTSGPKTFTVIVSQGGCSQTLTVDVTALGVPDLAPILYVSSSLLYGNSACSLVVDVLEINDSPTHGLIKVYISKDPLLNLSLTGTATLVGGRPVQNSVWTLDEMRDSGFYILTTSQSIGGKGKLSVGLSGQFSPGNTRGNLGVSGLVVGSGIGEQNTLNNAGAVKIDYFSK